MAGSDKPLTTFLIALCHSSDLLARFNSESRADVLTEWGLDGHPLFASESELTLAQVQDAVGQEFTGEGAVEVAWWLKIPDWVWGFGLDDSEGDGAEGT